MSTSLTFVFCYILIIAFVLKIEAYSWRSSRQGLPSNAVFGGYDGQKYAVFVARAKYNNMNILGYAIPIYNKAYIPYWGKEYVVDEWEYLIGDCFYWSFGYDGAVPAHAVSDIFENSVRMFVGRHYLEKSLLPGKIHTPNKIFYIAYYGKEYQFDKYEVLISCENTF